MFGNGWVLALASASLRWLDRFLSRSLAAAEFAGASFARRQGRKLAHLILTGECLKFIFEHKAGTNVAAPAYTPGDRAAAPQRGRVYWTMWL
jgi:hypothetical protein